MTDQTIQNIEQTAAALAPVVSVALKASNPAAASALALLPVALQLLNTAGQLTQAGGMTETQLADLFASVGAGISSAHAQWDALNGAQPAVAMQIKQQA